MKMLKLKKMFTLKIINLSWSYTLIHLYFKNNAPKAPIPGPLVQPVTSSLVQDIRGRGVRRAGRRYIGKKF